MDCIFRQHWWSEFYSIRHHRGHFLLLNRTETIAGPLLFQLIIFRPDEQLNVFNPLPRPGVGVCWRGVSEGEAPTETGSGGQLVRTGVQTARSRRTDLCTWLPTSDWQVKSPPPIHPPTHHPPLLAISCSSFIHLPVFVVCVCVCHPPPPPPLLLSWLVGSASTHTHKKTSRHINAAMRDRTNSVRRR